MTTFQAVVYGIIHGLSQFLPVSVDAHHWALSFFTGWPQPEGPLYGAMALGALLAVLVFFRHDWASVLSSFIQVLIFRKRPMTLDERMLFFIALSAVPLGATAAFLRDRGWELEATPYGVAAALVAFNVPLWLAERLNRKNKSMFDWNWLDSLIVGIGQCTVFIPGAGRQTGALTLGIFRNYYPDAAAKFAYMTILPLLIFETSAGLEGLEWGAAAPMEGVSWLSFWIALIVTFFTGLLFIGGFMKHVQKKGFGGYLIYRMVLATGIVAIYLFRG